VHYYLYLQRTFLGFILLSVDCWHAMSLSNVSCCNEVHLKLLLVLGLIKHVYIGMCRLRCRALVLYAPCWHQLKGPALLTYWGDGGRSLNYLTDTSEIVLGDLIDSLNNFAVNFDPDGWRLLESSFRTRWKDTSNSLWDYRPGVSSFCWVSGGDVSAGCVRYTSTLRDEVSLRATSSGEV